MSVVSFIRSIPRAIFVTMFTFLATALFAAPTVKVLSPGSGSFNGSPVFYQAYATSSSCSKGISAMRIYTASGVSAYTVNGAHIETFIALKPGSYNTVVQAWDNCGGVGKTSVAINVNSHTAVTVFQPNSPVGNIPNHIAASAQSPSCASGINAMRIYTATGAASYTVHSNHLNAFVNLLPGTYNFTVQAWDNCGKVLKSQFTQTVGGQTDGYFYAVNQSSGNVSEFQVNNGVLTNPNGSGTPPRFPAGTSPNFIAVDPGGWFAYVLAKNGIYAYQIGQSNGALTPVSGSPFAISGTGPSDIAIDPNGNFVFVSFQTSNTVSAYSINRSSGALTKTASVTGSGGPFAVNTDFSGQYLYAINNNFNSTQIFGYKINLDSGALSAVSGSPYTIPNANSGFALTATGNYLYAGTGTLTGGAYGYSVNFSTGALKEISGSPWELVEVVLTPQAVLADVRARYLWGASSPPSTTPQNWITGYDILSGGSLSNETRTDTGSLENFSLAEDVSGQYLFAAGADQNNCTVGNCANLVSSYTIGSNGDPVKLSGPLPTGGQSNANQGIGMSRKYGD